MCSLDLVTLRSSTGNLSCPPFFLQEFFFTKQGGFPSVREGSKSEQATALQSVSKMACPIVIQLNQGCSLVPEPHHAKRYQYAGDEPTDTNKNITAPSSPLAIQPQAPAPSEHVFTYSAGGYVHPTSGVFHPKNSHLF